jgi:hypothetical protein
MLIDILGAQRGFERFSARPPASSRLLLRRIGDKVVKVGVPDHSLLRIKAVSDNGHPRRNNQDRAEAAQLSEWQRVI